MGDDDKNANKKSDDKAEIAIQLHEIDVLTYLFHQSTQVHPPSVHQQVHYQDGTPVFQKELGGQNIYVVEPQKLPIVSRDRSAHKINYLNLNQPCKHNIFLDSHIGVKIRNRSIERVYTFLSAQLFFTFMFLLLIALEPNTKELFQKHGKVFHIIGAVLYHVSAIPLLTYSTYLRRNSLLNSILLGLLGLGVIFLLGRAIAYFPLIIVISAVIKAALVCMAISLFAFKTKWDVTSGVYFSIAIIATIALLIYGTIVTILILCGICLNNQHLICLGPIFLLYAFWLMYDTQTVRDQITGCSAASLYTEIIIIFAVILALHMQYEWG